MRHSAIKQPSLPQNDIDWASIQVSASIPVHSHHAVLGNASCSGSQLRVSFTCCTNVTDAAAFYSSGMWPLCLQARNICT